MRSPPPTSTRPRARLPKTSSYCSPEGGITPCAPRARRRARASTEVSASTSCEPRACALGGLVGEPPRAVRAVAEHIAVAVEDVVDDLEQQSELGARTRATAPAPRAGTSAAQSASTTDAEKRRPVFRRCSVGEVGAGAVDVEVLAADHPERRRGELARDVGTCRTDAASRNASARSASPARIRGASPNCRPDARLPSPLLVVVERGQVVVDERERVHELERARGRQRDLSTRPPAPRRPRGRCTGRTRLPPTAIEYRTDSAWPCSSGQSVERVEVGPRRGCAARQECAASASAARFARSSSSSTAFASSESS